MLPRKLYPTERHPNYSPSIELIKPIQEIALVNLGFFVKVPVKPAAKVSFKWS